MNTPLLRRAFIFGPWALVVGITLALGHPSASHATSDSGELKAAMASFYAALVTILVEDAKPAKNRHVDPALLTHIVSNADLVQRHFDGRMSDASYFAHRVRRSATAMHTGQLRKSWPTVSRAARSMVESCMFCHARQEGAVDSPLTAGITKHPDLLALPPRHRARTFAALRQFDASSKAWSEHLSQPSAAAKSTLRDDVSDFLFVELRAHSDGERAVEVLTKVAKQRPKNDPDRQLLKQWMRVIRTEGKRTKARASTKTAISQCRGYAEKHSDDDDSTVIYDVFAARDCYRVLAQPRSDLERAEAYVHLAAVEARLHGGRTPDRVVDLYALAMITAPQSNVAERAFGELEQWFSRLDASEPGGTGDLSEESRVRLDELRVHLPKAESPKR